MLGCRRLIDRIHRIRKQVPLVVLACLLLCSYTCSFSVTSSLVRVAKQNQQQNYVQQQQQQQQQQQHHYLPCPQSEASGLVACRLQAIESTTRLATVRKPHDVNDAQNDDGDENAEGTVPEASLFVSSSPTRQHRRIGRFRRKLRKWVASVALAGSLLFGSGLTRPAQAKFSYELGEQRTHSLRPGMSKTQAEQVLQGDEDVLKEVESKSIFDKADAEAEKHMAKSEASKGKAPAKSVKKKSSSDFLYDDIDDDFAFTEEDVAKGLTGYQVDNEIANKIKAKTSSQFAAYNKGKSTALTVKVAIALFAPTFGGMFIREHVRQRKEEAYVKKGLEILEAQKAEYFNVTSTAADSDVQDALKGLKKGKNATDTKDKKDVDNDDDDDDNDDDDEDAAPPRSSSSPPRPKRPSGGGDKDSSGSGSDPGYGRPSDEELDRLNKLFGKS